MSEVDTLLTFHTVSGVRRCDTCGGEVRDETFTGPCCGGEFECVDYYEGYVCMSCGRENDETAEPADLGVRYVN